MDGDTVTLVVNCAASDEIDVSCNIVLDLNGKTFTSTLPNESYKSALEAAGENASITVRDSGEGGKIISNNYGLSASHGGHLVMESGKIESNDAALTGNNTAGNMNFTVTGGTLTATKGPAIYMPGQVSLTITGGTLNGGISLRMGQVNISGGTINATTGSIDSPAEYYSYSGNAWLPDALYVFGGTYNSDDETYGNSLNLEITGGTFNCTNNQGSAVAIYDLGKVEQTMNVAISGDAVLTTNATSRNAYDVLSLSDIGVTSPKNGYNNSEYVGKVNFTITGAGEVIENVFSGNYFGYGNTASGSVTFDGEDEVVIDKWVDAWVNTDTTIKGVTFKNGAVFNAQTDNITLTLEDCTFYACDLEKITVTHKVNSGAGMCLNVEKAAHTGVSFVIKNCTFIGENDATLDRDGVQYNADGSPTGQRKPRGHAIALDAICGGGTGTLAALVIEECEITGVRGNAIQLYGNTGAITIKDTKIYSWGMNNNTAKDDAAIRGDFAQGTTRTITLSNIYFGLDENNNAESGKLLYHVNVGVYEGNTSKSQPAGTYFTA